MIMSYGSVTNHRGKTIVFPGKIEKKRSNIYTASFLTVRNRHEGENEKSVSLRFVSFSDMPLDEFTLTIATYIVKLEDT